MWKRNLTQHYFAVIICYNPYIQQLNSVLKSSYYQTNIYVRTAQPWSIKDKLPELT